MGEEDFDDMVTRMDRDYIDREWEATQKTLGHQLGQLRVSIDNLKRDIARSLGAHPGPAR